MVLLSIAVEFLLVHLLSKRVTMTMCELITP